MEIPRHAISMLAGALVGEFQAHAQLYDNDGHIKNWPALAEHYTASFDDSVGLLRLTVGSIDSVRRRFDVYGDGTINVNWGQNALFTDTGYVLVPEDDERLDTPMVAAKLLNLMMGAHKHAKVRGY